MAKKKSAATGLEVDSLEQDTTTLAEAQAIDAGLPQEPPAAEEEAPTPAPTPIVEAPKQHPWLIGEWHGKPNYQCPHKRLGKNPDGRRCPFVTIDLSLLTDHVDMVHPFSWLEQQGQGE